MDTNVTPSEKDKKNSAVRLVTFLLIAAAFVLVAYLYLGKAGEKISTATETHTEATTEGTPAIGGAFSLTNQRGEAVSNETFKGKYMLVYFGFSHCPDVCPVDLAVITQAMEKLGEEGKQIQPIFITVDPERDTPEQLATYATNFTPTLQALTGTKEQIKAAIDAYKVYATKAAAQAKEEAGGKVDEYSMNHSAFTYLMGPDGNYITHFAHDTAPDAMVEGIKKSLTK
ncbi:MAG: senC [Rickettsiales bacterium]|jgi:protein SCO1/2|nr:senC [Rickettsiales bacterium]